jgi:hypothetical protein
VRPLSGRLDRFDLSLRVDPDRGGPVADEVSGAGPLQQASCRHILLLVHGFNNTAAQANAAYAAMLANITPALLAMHNGPDAVVCLQWPGDFAVVDAVQAADAVGYPVDITQARKSADKLQAFLHALCTGKGPNFRISFIAHSLGCRLMLEALRPASLPLEVAALMAAAVPVRLVDITAGAIATLSGTDAGARAMLKFHSWLDMVLAVAFPAGQSLAFAMGIEPAPFLEAVGFRGDPSAFGTDRPTTYDTHGEYWGDAKIARQVAEALDVTLPPSPPVATIPSRPLPPASAIPARSLPTPRAFATRG